MTAMFLNVDFKPIYTVGAAECGRAEFKFRYLNNGYNYDSNILELFYIHCQYGQNKWWKNIG